jgi:Family of unknown function (DUF6114)
MHQALCQSEELYEMSDVTRQRPTSGFGQKRSSFREWRGQRPFWGGLLTLLAGIPIMYIPYQNFTLGSLTIRMATTAGAGSLIIGVLLVVLGLTMWFQPHSRVFAGVAAILLALVSLVVSNIGAFMIGFLLGLIGGALGIAWGPAREGEAKRESDKGADADDEKPAASSPTYSSSPTADRSSGDTAGDLFQPRQKTGTAQDDLSVFGSNGRHRAG